MEISQVFIMWQPIFVHYLFNMSVSPEISVRNFKFYVLCICKQIIYFFFFCYIYVNNSWNICPKIFMFYTHEYLCTVMCTLIILTIWQVFFISYDKSSYVSFWIVLLFMINLVNFASFWFVVPIFGFLMTNLLVFHGKDLCEARPKPEVCSNFQMYPPHRGI